MRLFWIQCPVSYELPFLLACGKMKYFQSTWSPGIAQQTAFQFFPQLIEWVQIDTTEELMEAFCIFSGLSLCVLPTLLACCPTSPSNLDLWKLNSVFITYREQWVLCRLPPPALLPINFLQTESWTITLRVVRRAVLSLENSFPSLLLVYSFLMSN